MGRQVRVTGWRAWAWLLLPTLLVMVAWVHAGYNRGVGVHAGLTATCDLVAARTGQADGTSTRQEMEYKFVIEGDPARMQHDDLLLRTIHQGLAVALRDELQWEAPRYVNATYSIAPIGEGTFCFLDIYVDSPDRVNEKWNIGHRVRYRWHSRGAFVRYLFGSESSYDYPHRCEFQVKTGRRELGDGFYIASETRFEFRNESFPFKRDHSAPPPPWPFPVMVPATITGHYGPYLTMSTAEYARYLGQVEPDRRQITLAPTVVEVMTRRRLHLNLATSWGGATAHSGGGSLTNAAQAMVVTLDTVEVHPPEMLNLYFLARAARQRGGSRRLERRLRAALQPAAIYHEIEFEFERNVETALHTEMAGTGCATQAAHLAAVEQAFLADQRRVSAVVRAALADLGLDAHPTNVSKYRKALRLLQAWRDGGRMAPVLAAPVPLASGVVDG